MSSIIVWIIIAIIAIIIDIATSNFLFVWFAIGAIASMIAAMLGLNLSVQVVIFLIVSVVTISIGYPLVTKKFKTSLKRIPLMEEKYIGRVMEAKEDIKEKARIKVDGIYWAAKNQDVEILKGEKFEIVSIEGTKLVIKKI